MTQNCKYSTTIGLDCVCIGVKEPYKVSPTHYCEDWLYWLRSTQRIGNALH